MIRPKAQIMRSEVFSLLFYRTAFFSLVGAVVVAGLVALSYIAGQQAKIRELSAVVNECGLGVEQ